mmetsp:Transcript_28800/g.31431  ORF Transcript_28800/g.31431 Transcript_28800/m.31431 type:complete len:142 (+) Transcript_28800:99-524(+)|eukprot:gene17157-19654_t
MGIIKNGRVVIVLAGKYAGRKAVVVKATEGGADKKFGQALVAGIDRYPRKVTRSMNKKKIEKRSKIKPFVKVLNFNHILPTRYSVDIDLKKTVDESSLASEKRVETRKAVKKILEDKYKTQTAKSDKKAVGVQYFFNKLRF